MKTSFYIQNLWDILRVSRTYFSSQWYCFMNQRFHGDLFSCKHLLQVSWKLLFMQTYTTGFLRELSLHIGFHGCFLSHLIGALREIFFCELLHPQYVLFTHITHITNVLSWLHWGTTQWGVLLACGCNYRTIYLWVKDNTSLSNVTQPIVQEFTLLVIANKHNVHSLQW